MDEPIRVNASLLDPFDPSDVTVTMSFAGVGTTDKISTGQRIRWTPEILRRKVKTLEGKPVNVLLNAEGNPTGHTTEQTVGAIKRAWFDEDNQVAMAEAVLWPHYKPKTVSRLKELFKAGNKSFMPSMEYLPNGAITTNDDGTVTPVDGGFSGVGFVGMGGDPRASIYLMAALKEDEKIRQEDAPMSFKDFIAEVKAALTGKPVEKEPVPITIDDQLQAAHEGSFEWLSRQVSSHLNGGDSMSYSNLIATYSNYAIYKDGEDNYYRVDYKRSGEELTFGEPQKVDPVYQLAAQASAEEGAIDDTGQPEHIGDLHDMTATPDELQAAKDEQIEELKASLQSLSEALDKQTKTNEALMAEKEKEDKEKKAVALADTRLAELEKIVPDKKDELKASLYESLKTLDDAGYEVVKASLAAAAQLRAGIAPDADHLENPEHDKTAEEKKFAEDQKKWQAEAAAKFGTGTKSKDKE